MSNTHTANALPIGALRNDGRIPFPTRAQLTTEQEAVYQKIVSGPRGVIIGPLRAAIYNPELADKWQELGALLRYRTSLPPRLSELAILVTARAWSSQFEWYAHAPVGLKAGLTPAAVEAIRVGEQPDLARDDEAAVYQFSYEMQVTRDVTDTTYARALALLGATAVVELTALLGYYTLVAMTLIAHRIPLPEGASPELPALGAPA